MATRPGLYSFADFLELVREDQKADLLDGVIHMASPENTDHNKLVLWLATILGQYVEGHDLGQVTVNKVAFRLAPKTAPEPDIGFVAAERVECIKHGYVDGPPDLAIEIVSPDSYDRDYHEKRRVYEQAGVREYWIIDPAEQKAMFLVRDGDSLVPTACENDVFRSRVIAGFEIDQRWLSQRPLPATLPIVQALLARGS